MRLKEEINLLKNMQNQHMIKQNQSLFSENGFNSSIRNYQQQMVQPPTSQKKDFD